MQETDERYEILVNVQFSNGNEYNQPLEIDSDGAQEFMDWFRNPKGGPVWSWQVPSCQRIHMFHRIHIAAVDVSGYIEPEFNKTKWYEKLFDKFLTMFIFLRMRGGELIERETETKQIAQQQQSYAKDESRDQHGES